MSIDLHDHSGAAFPPGEQGGYPAVRDDLPLVNDQQPIANGLDFLHHVCAQKYGVVLSEPRDQLPYLDSLIRVQPLRGFVEDQDVRLGEDRLGQTHTLAVSLREVGDGPIVNLCDSRLLDGGVNPVPGLRGIDSAQPGHEGQELPDQHIVVQGIRFGKVSDAAACLRRVLVHGAAIDFDRSGVRLQGPRDQAHGGGLPGPVGTEEADDLPPIDGERDAVHGAYFAEALGDLLQANQRHSVTSES